MITVRLNYDTNKFQRKGSLNPFLVSQLQSGMENPCLIKLTQGKFTLVDEKDFEELSRYKWFARKTSYGGFVAARRIASKTIFLHRIIMNAPKNMQVDHRNHNTLDNRCYNLRVCTRSQNQQNQLPQKNGSSKYKGVHWHKNAKKWQVQIRLNRRRYFLGYFNSKIEAAKIYDKKAKELFGEFARTNF